MHSGSNHSGFDKGNYTKVAVVCVCACIVYVHGGKSSGQSCTLYTIHCWGGEGGAGGS